MKQYDRNETMTPSKDNTVIVTGQSITELLDNVNAKQKEGYEILGTFFKTVYCYCQPMIDTSK